MKPLRAFALAVDRMGEVYICSGCGMHSNHMHVEALERHITRCPLSGGGEVLHAQIA